MANRSRWRGRTLCANATVGSGLFMVALLVPGLSVCETAGQHPVEDQEQLESQFVGEVQPARRPGRLMDSARGGTESKLALHMMWLLRVVWLVVGRTRGRVPATPTGPRPQTSLYPPGQRLPTEGDSVGTFFLFVNRRRDRIKILRWEPDGLVVFYKRLESGLVPDSSDPPRCGVDRDD